MFLKSRPLIEDDLRHWIVAEFSFAIDQNILRNDTPLILPTRDFFTAPGGKTPETVQRLVRDFQRLLHIEDAEIHVAPLNRVRAENQVPDYGQLSQVGGTWQPQGDDVGGAAVVHYDPDHLEYLPITLLATLHHELMHHVLLNDEEEFPEDMSEEELRTDLHCVTSGGGIIQVNGYEASGWGGYMRQPTRCYCLAVFIYLRCIPQEQVLPDLSARMRKYLKKALKELRSPGTELEALRRKLNS
ncbi:hypothetical protein [Halocynthiibacter styelae]|uniref:Uncharacterized protein n=1 Tax=Halocynthiibacter styelae TaxID=2761955 RepID=A0A8J7IYH3_9RHOB|nr:hypothetical protein [Paenihalocynthiibacter styelae]MBI1494575.1 hypothetical protein [Paenihalocynthiibacter styelae]